MRYAQENVRIEHTVTPVRDDWVWIIYNRLGGAMVAVVSSGVARDRLMKDPAINGRVCYKAVWDGGKFTTEGIQQD